MPDLAETSSEFGDDDGDEEDDGNDYGRRLSEVYIDPISIGLTMGRVTVQPHPQTDTVELGVTED